MADLMIDDELLQRLQDIAKEENRPVNEVLRSMVEQYPEKPFAAVSAEALLAMDGMFDDDVTDMSVTIRETMKDYYRKKYDDSH
ncbi:MAG: hypothetical protein GC204_07495 [Chloroflexi bacterium]|nr:hypothetical protein [Chloroflexota bacterium]